MPEANADLVRQLKAALAMAEAGKITNAVIVATGDKLFHRTFSVPKAEDMLSVIGELGTFKTEMELIVMGNRAQQQPQPIRTPLRM
jgi:hypothetical protein